MRLSFQKIKNLVLFLAIVPVRLPDFSCSPLVLPPPGPIFKNDLVWKKFFKKNYIYLDKNGQFYYFSYNIICYFSNRHYIKGFCIITTIRLIHYYGGGPNGKRQAFPGIAGLIMILIKILNIASYWRLRNGSGGGRAYLSPGGVDVCIAGTVIIRIHIISIILNTPTENL